MSDFKGIDNAKSILESKGALQRRLINNQAFTQEEVFKIIHKEDMDSRGIPLDGKRTQVLELFPGRMSEIFPSQEQFLNNMDEALEVSLKQFQQIRKYYHNIYLITFNLQKNTIEFHYVFDKQKVIKDMNRDTSKLLYSNSPKDYVDIWEGVVKRVMLQNHKAETIAQKVQQVVIQKDFPEVVIR